jgi:hypothetical protein
MTEVSVMAAAVAESQGRLRGEVLRAMAETERRLADLVGPRTARREALADLVLAFEVLQEKAKKANRPTLHTGGRRR